jgi:hypothetical protein
MMKKADKIRILEKMLQSIEIGDQPYSTQGVVLRWGGHYPKDRFDSLNRYEILECNEFIRTETPDEDFTLVPVSIESDYTNAYHASFAPLKAWMMHDYLNLLLDYVPAAKSVTSRMNWRQRNLYFSEGDMSPIQRYATLTWIRQLWHAPYQVMLTLYYHLCGYDLSETLAIQSICRHATPEKFYIYAWGDNSDWEHLCIKDQFEADKLDEYFQLCGDLECMSLEWRTEYFGDAYSDPSFSYRKLLHSYPSEKQAKKDYPVLTAIKQYWDYRHLNHEQYNRLNNRYQDVYREYVSRNSGNGWRLPQSPKLTELNQKRIQFNKSQPKIMLDYMKSILLCRDKTKNRLLNEIRKGLSQ